MTATSTVVLIAWDHHAIGLPRPRIAFAVGTYVRDGMAAAKVLHERLFTELRATERNHSDIAFGAGHLIGTTAMRADPARSVVDSTGRAHDVSNLFVAGSSVFPTEGTANPTLTLAALALRTADVLRRSLSHFPVVWSGIAGSALRQAPSAAVAPRRRTRRQHESRARRRDQWRPLDTGH